MNPTLDDKEFDARIAKLNEQHQKRQAIFASGYWSKEAIAQRYAASQSQNKQPINWEPLKTLHLQTDPTTQLNSIALNLTRIQTLATSNTGSQIAKHLIRESQYLTKGTLSTLNTESPAATALVDLQQQLKQWESKWFELWQDSGKRDEMATQAQDWCDRLRANSLLQANRHPSSPQSGHPTVHS